MKILCCILALGILPVVAYAEEPLPLAETSVPSIQDEALPELWFPVGEKLTYKVYWGLIPVGTTVATSEWIDYKGRKLLAIRFRTKSNSVLSKLYPVDDFIESIVDPVTFLPVRFTKKLSEGNYRCDETTHFFHDKGLARWQRNITGKEKTKEYKIQKDTRDLVSFMYNLRNKTRDLQIGEKKKFEVMADEKIYDLYVEPVGKEKVKLSQYGEIRSIKYEPDASFEGIFVRKGKMLLWASNDERRILTKIQAKVPVASVKILLDNVEGPGNDDWIRKQRKEGDKSSIRENPVTTPRQKKGR